MESEQKLDTIGTIFEIFEFWSKNETILVRFWPNFGPKKGVQIFFLADLGGKFFSETCVWVIWPLRTQP